MANHLSRPTQQTTNVLTPICPLNTHRKLVTVSYLGLLPMFGWLSVSVYLLYAAACRLNVW